MKLIAAAVLIDKDGRLLIAQRRVDQSLPLKWHLPGGELEKGESFTMALKRELKEELSYTIRKEHIKEEIANVTAVYPHGVYKIRWFRCKCVNPNLLFNKLNNDVKWIKDIGELNQYDWLDYDWEVARLALTEIRHLA